jgi:FMN-dependent NADH-azoreductase
VTFVDLIGDLESHFGRLGVSVAHLRGLDPMECIGSANDRHRLGDPMDILHIISTPRASASNTLRVSEAFFEALANERDDISVKTLDLFDDDLPRVAGENIEAKYTLLMGASLDPDHVESWQQIELLIDQFLAADLVVISVPMWNLSIPYALKYYIDAIVQPGYLFGYNDMGMPVGLVRDKKMVVITSRGGDYSPGTPFHSYDFMEPYLRAIFGFVGVYDIEFVNAQPVDISAYRETAFGTALTTAAETARRIAGGGSSEDEAVSPPADIMPQVILPEAEAAHEVSTKAGEFVFEQGDDADVIYVIDSGTVEVVRTDGGRHEVITTLTEGQYFGEIGALLGVPRAAGVRTVTDCRFTVYGPAEFRSVVLGH